MKATKANVRQWLLLVAAKCTTTMSVRELEDLLKLMVPTFVTHYATEAFSADSMEAVTKVCRFFKEADVRAALDQWCRENNPDKTGLPPEVVNAPLSFTEKVWAASWFRAETEADRIEAMNAMRGYSQNAFAWLINTDLAAGSLAVRKRWLPEADRVSRMQIEWGDPDAVLAAVRSCRGQHNDGSWSEPTSMPHFMGLLRAIVGKWAPQNLALIPEPGEEL